MHYDDVDGLAIIAVLLGLIVGFLLGSVVTTANDMETAIENKCAYYAPDTGDFTWLKDKM